MTAASSGRSWLVPLVPVYRLALAVRELRLRRGWEPVRRLRYPVISVGNLSTGGAGKTPFSVALSRALVSRGYGVDVLSRGYGRRSEAVSRVDPDGSPECFGDEPLLIAREAGVPVCVARKRYLAGALAEALPDDLLAAGAKAQPDSKHGHVHILDDGFQHRQLYRDVDILLLNREDWRDRLLPAGNLREPLQAANRADVLVIPEDHAELEGELRNWGWTGPVWQVRRCMEVPKVVGEGVAFCGIARPGQFFAGLENAGLRLADRIAFRDHHRYSQHDLDRVQSAARSAGAAALITTAKDQVRIEGRFASKAGDLPVLTAGLTMEIQDEADVLDWLEERLRGASAGHLSL